MNNFKRGEKQVVKVGYWVDFMYKLQPLYLLVCVWHDHWGLFRNCQIRLQRPTLWQQRVWQHCGSGRIVPAALLWSLRPPHGAKLPPLCPLRSAKKTHNYFYYHLTSKVLSASSAHTPLSMWFPGCIPTDLVWFYPLFTCTCQQWLWNYRGSIMAQNGPIIMTTSRPISTKLSALNYVIYVHSCNAWVWIQKNSEWQE